MATGKRPFLLQRLASDSRHRIMSILQQSSVEMLYYSIALGGGGGGGYAVVQVFVIPNAAHTLWIMVLSKLAPWSECNISGIAKCENKSIIIQTIHSAVWLGISIASAHFVK